MPQPVALVAADIHLDHLVWRNQPNITGDSFFGFEQVVGASVKRGLPFIAPGDVTEGLPVDTPDSLTIKVLASQIRKLRKAGIPLHYVNGQHDIRSRRGLSLVEACGGPPPADEQTVNIGGLNFYFLSWRPATQAQEAIESVPEGTDVLIMHQPCRELMGGSYEVRLDSVPHVKLVVSGDLHEYKKITVDREAKSTANKPNAKKKGKRKQSFVAVSPGATHARRISEPMAHYAVVINDDCTTERIKLRSRLCVRYSLDDAEGFEQMYRELPDALRRAEELAAERKLPPELLTPYFVIKDSSDLPDVKQRVQAAIGDRVHLFYSKTSLGFEADRAIGSSAPLKSLRDMVSAETVNPDAIDLIVSAMESEDAGKFVKTYRKQRGPRCS